VRHYPKGETIFDQESPSDALYAIISGRVKIISAGKPAPRADSAQI
jgi:CRP-like cAMP-binding protein